MENLELQSNEQVYSFKVKSFRKFFSPYGEYDESIRSPVVYECYVEIKDLPNNFPMHTNPREQNLKTKVSRNIQESLNADENNFHIKNRGIVISAADVKFNTQKSEVIITMDDLEVHGNIDGGHTYKIILDNRKSIDGDRFVKLEIIVGAEDFFQDLAKARNTSVQVKDTSIAELEQKFDLLKAPLSNIDGIDLTEHIAFKENESNKRLSIENIISILYNFYIEEFNDSEKQPVSTYSQKSYCVRQYLKLYDEMGDTIESKKKNPFYKMSGIIPDILKLYECIETTLPDKYKDAIHNGKYGALKGVQTKKENSKIQFRTEILDKETEFKSPRPFILPILASFRALVETDKDGMYKWKADPFNYYEKLGAQMIRNTVERSRTLGHNPNALGKDSGHWRDLYNLVDLEYKTHLIEKYMQQETLDLE